MTILEKPPPSVGRHAARGWHRFGHRDQVVRYTEAWEHETFAEEQARWERGDLEYARICEQVRLAKGKGGEASRCADEAKAEWDARVGAQRQANDDAQRADHALKADQTVRRGIMPESVRLHDQPAVTSAALSEHRAAPFRFRSRGTRTSVDNEPTKLEAR
jgi:hypothetical protein